MFRRPTYDWPPPPMATVRLRWLLWMAVAAGAAGALWLVGFVLAHDDKAPGLSDRGWATLVLTATLLLALYARQAAGTGVLLRALVEYAGVALLTVLLVTTATGMPLPGQARTAGPTTTTAAPTTTTAPASTAPPAPAPPVEAAIRRAGTGCPPVRQVPAWLGCLWRQANPPSSAIPTPSTSTRRTP